MLEAPKDGYTWGSGAAKDAGVYAVSGLLNTKLDDWHLYLAVINSSVIGVNPKTPYKTLDDLVKAMKEKPGEITVATAGVNSSGGAALGAFSTGAGVKARQVTYDGGNPAVIATAGGETQVTTQLAVEQAEMIRAGRIRPLAVVGTKPLTLEGVPEIPAITKASAPDLAMRRFASSAASSRDRGVTARSSHSAGTPLSCGRTPPRCA